MSKSQKKLKRKFNAFLAVGARDSQSEAPKSQRDTNLNLNKQQHGSLLKVKETIQTCMSQVKSEFYNGEYFGDKDVWTVKANHVKRQNQIKDVDYSCTSCFGIASKINNGRAQKDSDLAIEIARKLADKINGMRDAGLTATAEGKGYVNIGIKHRTQDCELDSKSQPKDPSVAAAVVGKTKQIQKQKQKQKQRQKQAEMLRISSAKHNFNIETVRATFTDEVFALYKKYQMVIHHDNEDDLTPQSFKEFLVDSPLQTKNQESQTSNYGTFHQLYKLDGKVIAVGVCDLLPLSLSSVYFFYDPKYSFLSLGKYSSLKEIEFVQKCGEKFPEMVSYYMGYYIASCPKMRYKANYAPSDLLCPETYEWIPLSTCRELIDEKGYSRLKQKKHKDSHCAPNSQLLAPLCNLQLPNGQILKLEDLTELGKQQLRPILEEFAHNVGQDLVRRLNLFFA